MLTVALAFLGLGSGAIGAENGLFRLTVSPPLHTFAKASARRPVRARTSPLTDLSLGGERCGFIAAGSGSFLRLLSGPQLPSNSLAACADDRREGLKQPKKVLGPVGLVPTGFGRAVWRNYEEVFDLARVGQTLLAATNGGLLRFEGGEWKPFASPAGERSIEQLRPLVVSVASGRRFVLDGAKWSECHSGNRVRSADTGLGLEPTQVWATVPRDVRDRCPEPPPAHVYTVLHWQGTVVAGTSNGLYWMNGGSWSRVKLPSAMPVSRPSGFAEVDGKYVIGGIDGLYFGRPGNWRQVCDDGIRQVRRVGSDVWVVHGSGALDKVDPGTGRLYPDVLTGTARRPWTSCIGLCGSAPLFGGQGGWAEPHGATRERYPIEITNEVVTAIAGRDDVRWVGTQKSGLVRFSAKGVSKWNPGNGLLDTWVTSLCRLPTGLAVGTMHDGLYLLQGDRLSHLQSPSRRIIHLWFWKQSLVVGGMDGAWIKRGARWFPLPTHGEETTSIAEAGGRLTITTATGIYFL